MSAQILDVTEAAHHADPCETPSLSPSIAKVLLDASPLHAWQRHPRLGGTPREATATFDHGHLVHALVLGRGAEIVTVDAEDWRTKAAREARDAARDAGKIPVLAGDLDAAQEGATKIRERLADRGLPLLGRSEVTAVWQEPVLGGSIWCRGRMDHVDSPQIVDLKTARSAHPRACVRHVIEYGYDVQAAAYSRALVAVNPELEGRVDFVFAFVETDPPYAVHCCRLDAMMREHGERRWVRACESWGWCLSRDEWPGYSTGIEYLEAPPWLLSRMEEGNDERQ